MPVSVPKKFPVPACPGLGVWGSGCNRFDPFPCFLKKLRGLLRMRYREKMSGILDDLAARGRAGDDVVFPAVQTVDGVRGPGIAAPMGQK